MGAADQTDARGVAPAVGLGVLLIGVFVATLDTFIVNVALPAMRRGLHAGYSDAELIVAGYTLTYATGLINGGRLGDRVGRRRVFLIGVGVFTLASGVCAAAPNSVILIGGRLVQGLGASLLTPQVLAIIRVGFSIKHSRARAFAAYGVAVGMASALGQILGGLIIEANLLGLGWRPIFLINVPLGLATIVLAAKLVPESRAEQATRADRVGVTLATVGLALLLAALIEGSTRGWRPWAVLALGVAALILVVFSIDQAHKSARNRSPLLDTRLFKERSFSVGTAALLGIAATMPSLYLAFTTLSQDGYRSSPFAAGVYFAPLALAFCIASAAAAQRPSADPRRFVVAGTATSTLGALVAVVVSLRFRGDVLGALVGPLALIGAGTGLFLTPVFNLILKGVPSEHAGIASGTLSTAQRVGNALGVAILEVPFIATYHHYQHVMSPADAYRHAFAAISAAVAATGALTTGLLLFLPVASVGPVSPLAPRAPRS